MHSGLVPFLCREVNALVDVPAARHLPGVVTLGLPAEQPEPKSRKPVDKVTRFLDGPVPELSPG